MDTLNTILPFYDALTKQEANKGINNVTRVCGNSALIPFLVKRSHSTAPPPTSISLIDCAGTVTEILERFTTGSNVITGWTNAAAGNGYISFASSGDDILTTYDTAPDVPGRCFSNSFVFTSGAIYVVNCTLTLNSGQAPSVVIADAAFSARSNVKTLSAGSNLFTLQTTAGGTYSFWVYNTGATNFSITFTTHKLSTLNLYSYTSVDYLQYNGNTLSSNVQLGRYYLRTYNGTTYNYSEWFDVKTLTNYAKIEFTNSLDIGDILYQHSFSQECYLCSNIREIEPDIQIEGDSRDGVLIKEKVTTSPKYRMVDFISPSHAAALKLLTGHETISITDTLNFTWTPNNIEVNISDEAFDICKIEITFTSGEKIWTMNLTNIT